VAGIKAGARFQPDGGAAKWRVSEWATAPAERCLSFPERRSRMPETVPGANPAPYPKTLCDKFAGDGTHCDTQLPAAVHLVAPAW